MTSVEKWPSGLTPELAPVYTHNQLHTSVLPTDLWTVLTKVTDWPNWYPHATNVRTTDGETTLRRGSVFRWKTLGVTVTTEVVEFEPATALAWKATTPISRAFHRWDFAPDGKGSWLVTTEETEAGIGPRLLAGRLKRDLLRAHQVWLEELVKRATAARS